MAFVIKIFQTNKPTKMELATPKPKTKEKTERARKIEEENEGKRKKNIQPLHR